MKNLGILSIGVLMLVGAGCGKSDKQASAPATPQSGTLVVPTAPASPSSDLAQVPQQQQWMKKINETCYPMQVTDLQFVYLDNQDTDG